jgi:S1-C subfamily serine protease
MRTTLLIPFALAAGAVAMPAAAQVVVRTAPRAYAYSVNTGDSPRAVIGVTMSTGDARDTLGIRISEVASDSPAEKAGIKEGDRIQSINGINLKLAPIDVGDDEMADAMSRRLTRELGKLKPGDEVSLKVYHDGSVKTVSVKTVDSDDLYNTMGTFMKRADNRAVLGVSLSVTGSKRDTLGVLIIGVNDDGPAAKAGLEEGNRIAAINGVDLKVDHADAGDSYVSNARYQRLQKEMEKVKPGDNVTLQVYADGRFKTVQIKTIKASDLAGNAGTFIFNGGVPGGMSVNIDGQKIREQVEGAMDQMRRSLNEVRIAPRVRWMNEDDGPMIIPGVPEAPEPPTPPMPAMAPRVRAVPGRAAVASVAPMPAMPEPPELPARAVVAPAIAGVATPMPPMPAVVHGYRTLAPTRYVAPGKRLIRF